MPEKKDGLEEKASTKCTCCPYGFHIDRDFVRYCDSLYNSAQLEKLRQHKRERRKEKKTVESYLGLGNMPEITSSSIRTKSPITIPQKIPQSSATLPHTFHYLQHEGLENAVLDFEDTWQKSLKKSCSSNDIISKRNGLTAIYSKPNKTQVEESRNVNSCNYEQSRSSSNSSISSQSTAISSTSVPVTSDSSVNSPQTMGINKTVLSSIRERMACSLQRMKELEDQVKTIPVLQVKLYALAEERSLLLNQLKTKESTISIEKPSENDKHLESQLKRLENQGIMSPTLSRKCLSSKPRESVLSSPGIASWLDANITKKTYIEKEIISHLKVGDAKSSPEILKPTKNAATSCSVLTRDIGIGYVPNKFKSVAVGSDISFNDLVTSLKNKKNYDQCTSVSSESLESDAESLAGSEELSRSFAQSRFRKMVSSSSNTSNIPIKCCVAASTNTDIKYYSSKSINTDQSPERIFKHKSISVSPIVSTKFVQTFDKTTLRSIGSQTSIDFKLKNEEAEKKHVVKRETGVGDFNINDIQCLNCKK